MTPGTILKAEQKYICPEVGMQPSETVLSCNIVQDWELLAQKILRDADKQELYTNILYLQCPGYFNLD